MFAKIIEFLKAFFKSFSSNKNPQPPPEIPPVKISPPAEKSADIPKVPTKIIGEVPGWYKWFFERLGWTEFDHDVELSKGWKYTHLDYKTVIGTNHAWCAMSLCSALEENGFISSGSAAASSYANFGETCEFKLGAILPIVHPNGNHHVTLFAGWHDKENKIALCLGGNQGNSINISKYNLSGNKNGHDEVMSGGPRWPLKKKMVLKD